MKFKIFVLCILMTTTSGCADLVQDFLKARESAETENPSEGDESSSSLKAEMQTMNGGSKATSSNSSVILKTQHSNWGVQSGQHSIRLSISKQGNP